MQQLRIGLVVEGPDAEPRIRGWQADLFRALAGRPGVEVALAVHLRPPAGLPPANRGNAVWRGLTRLEDSLARRRFARAYLDEHGDPDALHALGEVAPDLPIVEAVCRRIHDAEGEGLSLSDGDLAAIRAAELGLLLRLPAEPLGAPRLAGGILRVARHGLLALHHGDDRVNRGHPTGFWEVYHGHDFTGALLAVPGARPEDTRVVARARYKTFLRSWSENRRRVELRSVDLVCCAVDRLLRTGELPTAEDGRLLSVYCGPNYAAPSALRAAVAFARIGLRSLRQKLDRALFKDRWGLIYRRSGDPRNGVLGGYSILEPPPGRFYADPFLIERAGETWAFFEDMDIRRDRGRIACTRLDGGRPEKGPRPASGGSGAGDAVIPVLERDYHLSYPFLFTWKDSLYMLPESAANRTLELWRCTDFPQGWVKERTIFSDVVAVDSTLLHHDDGLWYLFTNLQRGPVSDHPNELHVFVNEDPVKGDWRPHAANPVVSCAESARMGGAFFRLPDGRRVRPAQNGAGRYGAGLLLAEVEALSPTHYRERVIEQIAPTWRPDAIGVHHLCIGAQATVFDVNLPRAAYREFGSRLEALSRRGGEMLRLRGGVRGLPLPWRAAGG